LGASGQPEATTRYRRHLVGSDSQRVCHSLRLLARAPHARIRSARRCARPVPRRDALDLGKCFGAVVLDCRLGLPFRRCGLWSSM
jgi:hypothetical protein